MTFVRKGEHFMNNFDIIKLNEDIIKDFGIGVSKDDYS